MDPNDPSITRRGRNAKFYAAEYPEGYDIEAPRVFHEFENITQRARWVLAGPGRGELGERREVHPKNTMLITSLEDGEVLGKEDRE